MKYTAEALLRAGACRRLGCKCDRTLRSTPELARPHFGFVHCPLHPDGPPTLCITKALDGAVQLACWSGCNEMAIWASLILR